MFGSVETDDPVAMIIFFPLIWLSEPSELLILIVSFESKLPCPLK